MGARILYSPSPELVSEKFALSSGEFGAREEFVVVGIKEL